jgi:3',5'-cyclic AMP phosphodiesterase CpdA
VKSGQLTIVQISDIHCGHVLFDAELMEHAIQEILEAEPDVDRLNGLQMVVIPGNHDLMNVGFLHFRDAFGKSERVVRIPFGGDVEAPRHATIVALNSSKPDLAEGEVGHIRYDWIRDSYANDEDYKVFVLHHHLVPVPGTGRERNIVWDAGDVLALLAEIGVDLVLAGHKHVPNVWLFDEMLLVNSGTATSHRVRGYTRPSYNLIEVDAKRVRIVQRYPGLGEIVAASYTVGDRRLDLNPQLAGMFDRGAWNV